MNVDEKQSIVVIEDEPVVADLIRDALEAEGYDVHVVLHPAQLERFIEGGEPPDLMLVDLMLPEISGNRLVEIMRQSPLAHTPMVAMSADFMQLLFARRSGLFQDALSKPFDLSTLVRCVRTHAGAYVTV